MRLYQALFPRGTTPLPPSYPADYSLVLDFNGTATLTVGQSLEVRALVVDGAGELDGSAPVAWVASDPTKIAVAVNPDDTQRATILALAAGDATVTAHIVGGAGNGDDEDALPVTVPTQLGEPAAITVTLLGDTVQVGRSLGASAAVRDAAGNFLANAAVTWRSADSSVASVAQSGSTSRSATVTGVSVGSTLIIASAGTSSGTIEGSAAVNVAAAQPVGDLAPLAFDLTRSPHAPHASFHITDFRTSYIEPTRRDSNRLWLAGHADALMSAGHIPEYTAAAIVHLPYTLLFAPFSTDKPGDLLGNSGPYYEQWCIDNARDPEDGYVHLAAGVQRYAWPIASIDTSGKVTLKYGSRWAFENGDVVTITSGSISGAYAISNVSWVASGEEGLTTFTIPVAGVATTGGTARNGVASGNKTAKDRRFFDINGYPPPRYLINPLSTVRRDFEIWRTAEIQATVYAYEPDYQVPGLFIDEVVPTWAVITGSLEFDSAGSDYNAALASLMGQMYASMVAPNNVVRPNVGSYINKPGAAVIADAAKSIHAESTLNPYQRGMHASWTWFGDELSKGVSVVIESSFSWWDTAPASWGGGLYKSDPLVVGTPSLGMLREKLAEYCAYLMVAQPPGATPPVYCDLWRGTRYTVDGDWASCWLPIFEVDLGPPMGARFSLGTFTNSKGLKVRATARRFANALVVVGTPDDWENPNYTDAGAVTVPLPADGAPFQLVHSDRHIDPEAITSITIRPAEGAILWATPTP